MSIREYRRQFFPENTCDYCLSFSIFPFCDDSGYGSLPHIMHKCIILLCRISSPYIFCRFLVNKTTIIEHLKNYRRWALV